MQLDFANDSLRLLCNTPARLMQEFGAAGRSVAKCMRILESLNGLAEIAAFAAIVFYQVWHAVEGVVEFVIEYAAVQLRFRSLTSAPATPALHIDREGLALIRAVSIVSVTLLPATVGA